MVELDDDLVHRIGCHVVDKGFIDFKLVQRQAAQEREGGITRAEIVDRYSKPQVAQLHQSLDSALRIQHHGRFRQFENNL